VTESCNFPTKEIIGAQNFNYAVEFMRPDTFATYGVIQMCLDHRC